MTGLLLGIVGTLLTIDTTVALFYLNSIKDSQEKMVGEIKEITTDIRDILSKMSANDVKFDSLNSSIRLIEYDIKEMDKRVRAIETR